MWESLLNPLIIKFNYNESQQVNPVYTGVAFSSGCIYTKSAQKHAFRHFHWERSEERTTGIREVPAVYLRYLTVCWLLCWSFTFGSHRSRYFVVKIQVFFLFCFFLSRGKVCFLTNIFLYKSLSETALETNRFQSVVFQKGQRHCS